MSTSTGALPLIWMYHSVDERGEDPFDIVVSPGRFAAQMRWLARRGLRGVSVRDLLDHPGSRRGLVGLTFDDGYADFDTDVVPVLAGHGFTATVYVVAGRIGGHNAWDADVAPRALMDAAALRRVAAAGMEVASHTHSHPHLPAAGLGELDDELTTSRNILQDVLGAPVTGFAYPYGELTAREIAAVRRAGYEHACAVRPGRLAGRHALPRRYVGDRDTAARLLAKTACHRLRWELRR
ncbi:polysaccharide deacetylase family protein [Nonomuraea spiralis]|uniref:Polysaccharide deacetylase family protein n=1 Tax=Nonomuraea spiralis TaxID=46182 RepID=A0ABV5II66_9ACTN|nr:polysaccharide deacetylase family protein [Nonomuraea spiralis]GGS98011.1 polysaccharide deacetylase [Nonomuraea spiralis]